MQSEIQGPGQLMYLGRLNAENAKTAAYRCQHRTLVVFVEALLCLSCDGPWTTGWNSTASVNGESREKLEARQSYYITV